MNISKKEEKSLLYEGSFELRMKLEKKHLGGETLESLKKKRRQAVRSIITDNVVLVIVLLATVATIIICRNLFTVIVAFGILCSILILLTIYSMNDKEWETLEHYYDALRTYKTALLALSPDGELPINPVTSTRRLVAAENDFRAVRQDQSLGVDQVVAAGLFEKECREKFESMLRTLENSFGLDYYDRKKLLAGKRFYYKDPDEKSSESKSPEPQ